MGTAQSVETGASVMAFNPGLFLEGVETSATPAFSIADLSDVGMQRGHTVYNFEVEGTHTYIADGIRVHNTSALSFLSDDELITDISTDSAGRVIEYQALLANGYGSVTATTESLNQGNTVTVEKTYQIDRDGHGPDELVLQNTYEINPNTGETTLTESDIVSANLRGQVLGSAAAGALTPFFTAALVGDDASVLETIAADTVIGTVLENVGELIGGTIDIYTDSWLRANTDGSTVIGDLTDLVFEDFGGDLALNGVNSTISVVNQLILSEIFEVVEIDGVPGAIFETVVGSGLNVLLTHGADQLLSNLFDHLPDGSFLGQLSADFSPAAFGDPVSLVLSAVLSEVLPSLETLEGQVASAVTSALLGAWSAFQGSFGAGFFSTVGGPVGVVIGFFVGKIFDSLFKDEPQAWTNVGFDEDTGQFVVLNTWQDDGGNTELSRSIAEAYVDAMNAFVDAVVSESHNYNELAQWTFGHFEEFIKNAGRSGQSFGTAYEAYLNAYISDLSETVLNDGKMVVVRALEQLDLSFKLDQRAQFSQWDPIIKAIQAFTEEPSGSITLTQETGLNQHRFGGATFSWTADQSFQQKYENLILVAYEKAFRTLEQQGSSRFGPDYQSIASGIESIFGPLLDIRSPRRGSGEDPGETWHDVFYRTVHGNVFDTSVLDLSRSISNFPQVRSMEELLNLLGIQDPDFLTDEEALTLVSSSLQVAEDYFRYLEDVEVINTLIAAAPESALAGGWITTLIAAEDLGLNEAFDLTGDTNDNVFYTADGDDVVRGGAGDDYIKTYGGDDRLLGQGQADTLDAGRGDDELIGGSGGDLLIGGAGNDEIFGGNGSDEIIIGDGAGTDVVSTGTGSDVITVDVVDATASTIRTTVTDFDLGVDRLMINGTEVDLVNGTSAPSSVDITAVAVGHVRVSYGDDDWVDLTNLGQAFIPDPTPIGMAGSVTVSQSGSDQWHTVNFAEAIENAIVVMGPIEALGSNPAITRVKNVTDTGFQFQIDEWDYLDGGHIAETIGWLAISEGSHTLGNGQTIVAGSTVVGKSFETVSIGEDLTEALVFTEVTSTNSASAVTTRTRNVTSNEFQVQLETEQARTSHPDEEVSWIVVEAGSGSGIDAVRTANTIDERYDSFSFSENFDTAPVLIADLQTNNGGDPIALRYKTLSENGFQVVGQEEKSKDAEVGHVDEVGAWLALEEGLIF